MEANPQFSSNGTHPVARQLRVYLATKFSNKAGFRKMKKIIEDAGHKVILDWTLDDASKFSGDALEEYLKLCAIKSLAAIANSDVLVLLAKPDMRGSFVEVGMAIGLTKPVLILDGFKKGNQECIFYHLPQCGYFQHLKSTEDLLKVLGHGRNGGVCDPIPEAQEAKPEAPNEERPDFTPGRN